MGEKNAVKQTPVCGLESSKFGCFNGGECDVSTNTCTNCDPLWMHNRAQLKLNDCTQSIPAVYTLSIILGILSFYVAVFCLYQSRKYHSTRRRLLFLNGIAHIFSVSFIISHALSNFELSIPAVVLLVITACMYSVIAHFGALANMNPIQAIAMQSPKPTERISQFWNGFGIVLTLIVGGVYIYAIHIQDDQLFNLSMIVHSFINGMIVNINSLIIRFTQRRLVAILKESNNALTIDSTRKQAMTTYLHRLDKNTKDFNIAFVFVLVLVNLVPILFVTLGTIPYIWLNHFMVILVWILWGKKYYGYCTDYKKYLPPGYEPRDAAVSNLTTIKAGDGLVSQPVGFQITSIQSDVKPEVG